MFPIFKASSKTTFECPFEDGLTVNLELLLDGLEGFHAFVQLAEEFFYLGDDAVLFKEGREGQINISYNVT